MEKITKRAKKIRDNWQGKDASKLRKRPKKSVATLNENAEISNKMALKIFRMPPTDTSKCHENTNSEYTIRYTKHIKYTY